MTDLALVLNESTIDLDLQLNDIKTDDGLETAVLISLFTDRRALADDVIVDGSNDKRGSWMDSYPDVDDDNMGSRFWLLCREKSQTTVRQRARDYGREACQWMLDDGVAKTIAVNVEALDAQSLLIVLNIVRPSDEAIQFKFEINWMAQALKK